MKERSEVATDDAKSVVIPTVAVARPPLGESAGRRKEVTAEDRARYLDWLSTGQSLPALYRVDKDIPWLTAFVAERSKDPAFDKACDEAREAGLTLLIDESMDYSASSRGDKALAIAASRYAETINKAAALLAPKKFGAMVRHAGHDGEALTVSVVSFKDTPVTIEGGPLKPITGG